MNNQTEAKEKARITRKARKTTCDICENDWHCRAFGNICHEYGQKFNDIAKLAV